MNYRFRKKPIVIEAFQMTEYRRDNNTDWPEWLNAAWNEEPGTPGCVRSYDRDPELGPCQSGDPLLTIDTLEGSVSVSPNDYIIRGIKRELYPCKPDIFKATYEEVLEPFHAEVVD